MKTLTSKLDSTHVIFKSLIVIGILAMLIQFDRLITATQEVEQLKSDNESKTIIKVEVSKSRANIESLLNESVEVEVEVRSRSKLIKGSVHNEFLNRDADAVPTMEELDIIGAPYGIPGKLLLGVMLKESHGDNTTVSKKQAKGAFQFLDSTAKYVNLDNTKHNFFAADAAARYLAYLHIAIYGYPVFEGDNGTYSHMLAAYNAGLKNVIRKGIRIPRNGETPNYVSDVMGFFTGEKHYVLRGETLQAIAKKHSITVDDIIVANYGVIRKNQDLKYGQFIYIDASAKTYTVQQGDTLTKIAKTMKLTTDDLRFLNIGVDPRNLRIGSKLKVRL